MKKTEPRDLALALALATVLATPRPAQAQLELCAEVERFARDLVGMVALAEPDTIDDWRTRAMVPGCRVTAVGTTRRSHAAEARRFYELVRASGWLRTPDPRDAPNEASLRFRRDGADCLYNYYTSASPLNTEAELTVLDAVERRPGERLFHVLVMCTPAAPAAPHG